jgi:regulator of replication initiation timing
MNLLTHNGAEWLPTSTLRRLVLDLSQRLGALEAQVAELGDQLEQAETARAALQVQNQSLRNQFARLKNLPPRPLVRELAISVELSAITANAS